VALFSERYGYKEVRTALQHEELDQHLRVDLWNAVHIYLEHAHDYTEHFLPFVHIWINLWRRPYDAIPYRTDQMGAEVKRYILDATWYDVLDLIETFVKGFPENERSDKPDLFNLMFERNVSAYRLVDDHIVEMNEATDVEAVTQALKDAADVSGARRHLAQALSHLSDRDHPDYANSIKESISAVERVCQYIIGKSSATLGEGIKALKDAGVRIHPAQERSWLAAYGYASDGDGIRHALRDDTTANQANARYWLVSCSAFVSLLLSEAASVGIGGSKDA
jgi:hypothetical protein